MPAATLRRAVAWMLALLAFAFAHALLLGNPGYFSHDELQWAARAAAPDPAASVATGWLAVDAFQYRPLTFRLWLLLSTLAFDTPWALHGVWLGFGFGVCALLYLVLRNLQPRAGIALAGATAFAFNPYAAFVHGWVATLSELLWVAFSLGIVLAVLGEPRERMRMPALIAAAGTVLALLSKEAALAIAPLLAWAWLASGREPRWCAALLGSLVPTAIYLALRLPILMSAPRPDDAYSWSLQAIPLRWASFQLWPWLVTTAELDGVAHASTLRLAMATAIAVLLALCTLRAGKWKGATWVVGGALALGPTLLLPQAYTQYGYGYSALACACLALSWPRLRRAGRALLLFALLLSSWHGVNVQRELRRVGELQARFSPALAAALSPLPMNTRLRLQVEREQDRGVYARLVRDIPSYAGVPIGARVELVDDIESADGRIEPDGDIAPRH